ncbi:CRTAC1 family protein [Bremerella cremea]|uniref:CRTAC1 family protein n=1 Tax=Bremerella cremea TaxID=1031537 RepID=UPI0011C04DC8|nr:CRTAC1 family protein [Bremerella cremea]
MPFLFFLIILGGCSAEKTDSVRDKSQHSSPKVTTPDNIPDRDTALLPSELPREPVTRDPHESDWFEEVAQASGVDHVYRAGFEASLYTLLETVGGGVSMVDFDRDGDVDLFISGGGVIKKGPPVTTEGLPSRLFRNEGNWTFRDVTDELKIPTPGFYSHGCSTADFNRDGWPDLLVAGYGGVQLLKNDEGKGFVDVTSQAGLGDCARWYVQGCWVDFDNDGHLDLYLMTYADWSPDPSRICHNEQNRRDVCGPTLFEGQRDMLLRNQQDGTFADVTEKAGLVPENRGLGIVCADFNGDRIADIFVGNDVQFNQLYLSQAQLPFVEEGLLAGVAVSSRGEREGTMGVAVGDYNRDGLPDLWYTNFANQDNSLCEKESAESASFQNVTVNRGLAGVSRPWVGFGTILADFNHDRWLDIFIANGHVGYERLESPYYQPPQLFMNEEGKHFQENSKNAGPYFHGKYSGRGVAVGDLDNDGALDLVVVHQDDPVAILRNRLPCPHWIRLQLLGTQSNTDGIGAKVRLLNQDLPLSAWVTGSDSYASSSDRRVLFSLDDGSPVDVEVTWMSGITEVFSHLQPQETHELVEGQGRSL